jgi:hypothetical protein
MEAFGGAEDAPDAALLTFRLLNRTGLRGSNPQDAVGAGPALLTKHAIRQKFSPSHASIRS